MGNRSGPIESSALVFTQCPMEEIGAYPIALMEWTTANAITITSKIFRTVFRSVYLVKQATGRAKAEYFGKAGVNS